MVGIGRRLTDARSRVAYRQWLPWLELEFAWAERTALGFMQVYEAFGSDPQRVADLQLPIRSLFALAAPSTPAEVREVALERTTNGERLTLKQVNEMLTQARKEEVDKHDKQLAAAGQVRRGGRPRCASCSPSDDG